MLIFGLLVSRLAKAKRILVGTAGLIAPYVVAMVAEALGAARAFTGLVSYSGGGLPLHSPSMMAFYLCPLCYSVGFVAAGAERAGVAI